MALMSKSKNIKSKTFHFETKDKYLYQDLPNGGEN